MKNLKPKFAISLILMFMVGFTHYAKADSGVYAGVNYSKIDYSEGGYGDLDFTTRGIILGYNLSSTFGIEARYSKGSSGDDIFGYGVKIDNVRTVFGRLSLQNDTNLTPYVLLGYTRGKMTIEDIGSATESDLSYGVGLGFDVSDSFTVAAEYIVLMDKDNFDFTSFGVNSIYTF